MTLKSVILNGLNYEIIKFLGQGAISMVYLAQFVLDDTPTLVVIKTINDAKSPSDDEKWAALLEEARVLRLLNKAEDRQLDEQLPPPQRLHQAKQSRLQRSVVALIDSGDRTHPYLVLELAPPPLEMPPCTSLAAERNRAMVALKIATMVDIVHRQRLSLKDFAAPEKFDRFRLEWLDTTSGSFDLKVIDWNITGGVAEQSDDMIALGKHLYHLFCDHPVPIGHGSSPTQTDGWRRLSEGSRLILRRLLEIASPYPSLREITEDLGWWSGTLRWLEQGALAELKRGLGEATTRPDRVLALIEVAQAHDRVSADDPAFAAAKIQAETSIDQLEETQSKAILAMPRMAFTAQNYPMAIEQYTPFIEGNYPLSVKRQAAIHRYTAEAALEFRRGGVPLDRTPWDVVTQLYGALLQRNWMEADRHASILRISSSANTPGLKQLLGFAAAGTQFRGIDAEFQQMKRRRFNRESSLQSEKNWLDDLRQIKERLNRAKEQSPYEVQIYRMLSEVEQWYEAQDSLVDDYKKVEQDLEHIGELIRRAAEKELYDPEIKPIYIGVQDTIRSALELMQQILDRDASFADSEALQKKIGKYQNTVEDRLNELDTYLRAVEAYKTSLDACDLLLRQGFYEAIIQSLNNLPTINQALPSDIEQILKRMRAVAVEGQGWLVKVQQQRAKLRLWMEQLQLERANAALKTLRDYIDNPPRLSDGGDGDQAMVFPDQFKDEIRVTARAIDTAYDSSQAIGRALGDAKNERTMSSEASNQHKAMRGALAAVSHELNEMQEALAAVWIDPPAWFAQFSKAIDQIADSTATGPALGADIKRIDRWKAGDGDDGERLGLWQDQLDGLRDYAVRAYFVWCWRDLPQRHHWLHADTISEDVKRYADLEKYLGSDAVPNFEELGQCLPLWVNFKTAFPELAAQADQIADLMRRSIEKRLIVYQTEIDQAASFKRRGDGADPQSRLEQDWRMLPKLFLEHASSLAEQKRAVTDHLNALAGLEEAFDPLMSPTLSSDHDRYTDTLAAIRRLKPPAVGDSAFQQQVTLLERALHVCQAVHSIPCERCRPPDGRGVDSQLTSQEYTNRFEQATAMLAALSDLPEDLQSPLFRQQRQRLGAYLKRELAAVAAMLATALRQLAAELVMPSSAVTRPFSDHLAKIYRWALCYHRVVAQSSRNVGLAQDPQVGDLQAALEGIPQGLQDGVSALGHEFSRLDSHNDVQRFKQRLNKFHTTMSRMLGEVDALDGAVGLGENPNPFDRKATLQQRDRLKKVQEAVESWQRFLALPAFAQESSPQTLGQLYHLEQAVDAIDQLNPLLLQTPTSASHSGQRYVADLKDTVDRIRDILEVMIAIKHQPPSRVVQTFKDYHQTLLPKLAAFEQAPQPLNWHFAWQISTFLEQRASLQAVLEAQLKTQFKLALFSHAQPSKRLAEVFRSIKDMGNREVVAYTSKAVFDLINEHQNTVKPPLDQRYEVERLVQIAAEALASVLDQSPSWQKDANRIAPGTIEPSQARPLDGRESAAQSGPNPEVQVINDQLKQGEASAALQSFYATVKPKASRDESGQLPRDLMVLEERIKAALAQRLMIIFNQSSDPVGELGALFKPLQREDSLRAAAGLVWSVFKDFSSTFEPRRQAQERRRMITSINSALKQHRMTRKSG